MGQTLFLKDFTVLDFALLDEGLRGESFYVSAELEGELDEQGFILDFGPAKKTLKSLVDETLDHTLVVPALHPGLSGTAAGFRFRDYEYEAPAAAVTLLETESVTRASLEDFLGRAAAEILPANVRSARFFLRAEPRFQREAHFHYTHGLRLHRGNCQRLLHGHRNPVEVWIEGERNEAAEAFLAREWNGAHFTFRPSLVTPLDLPLGERRPFPGLATVEYESEQGFFRASLPAEKIILLETEPSIENIARLGVKRLRQQGEKRPLRVVAYEGLNKGAAFS